jgi:hypothetical protein
VVACGVVDRNRLPMVWTGLDFDDFLGSGHGQTEIASRHIAQLSFPAKSRSRFLLPISSRQIDESIFADFFPPNESISNFYRY